MITKKRLEELIKEEATIYVITIEPFIAGVSNFIGIQKENLSKENNIGKDNTLYWKDMGIAELEYLYETKEEAEWYVEFRSITRTETLSLPTFELLPKELDTPFIRYNEELESFVLYELYTYNNEIGVLCREIYDDASDCLFRKPLTKENYLEACRICKKLFLGE